LLKSIQAHSSTIFRIKQLPNGYVATSGDYTVKIWNPSLNMWSLVQTYSHSNYAHAFDYINKDIMVSSSSYYTNQIQIWLISTGETIRTITLTGSYYYYYSVNSLKLLKNGYHLAVGQNGAIYVYNINTGDLVYNLVQYSSVNDIIRINDELCAGSDYQRIFVWNTATKTNKFNLYGHGSYVHGLKQISSDILASGSEDSTIKLWNITDGTLIRTLTNHTAAVYQSIDLINDRKTILSASYDGTIRLWDWETGKVARGIYTGLNIYSLAVLDPIQGFIIIF
jgi:WD40 repeat protein